MSYEHFPLMVSAGSLYYAQSSQTDGGTWSLKHNIDYISLRNEFPQIFKSGVGFHPFAIHPLNPELVLVKLWSVPNCRYLTSLETYIYHTGTAKIELINNFDPNHIYPVIPYCLPAWLPCLKNSKKLSTLPRTLKRCETTKGRKTQAIQQ